MAKKRIVEKEPELILNAREPALGIGILKKKSDGTCTFELVRVSADCDCASPKNPCKHTLALALNPYDD
jgi:hypothetical protein